jgi:hypothetical protein
MILHLRYDDIVAQMTRENMTADESVALAVMLLHASRMLCEQLNLAAISGAEENPDDTEHQGALHITEDFLACLRAACMGVTVPLEHGCKLEDLKALDAYLGEFEGEFWTRIEERAKKVNS